MFPVKVIQNPKVERLQSSLDSNLLLRYITLNLCVYIRLLNVNQNQEKKAKNCHSEIDLNIDTRIYIHTYIYIKHKRLQPHDSCVSHCSFVFHIAVLCFNQNWFGFVLHCNNVPVPTYPDLLFFPVKGWPRILTVVMK